jgi:hypothetical protein
LFVIVGGSDQCQRLKGWKMLVTRQREKESPGERERSGVAPLANFLEQKKAPRGCCRAAL